MSLTMNNLMSMPDFWSLPLTTSTPVRDHGREEGDSSSVDGDTSSLSLGTSAINSGGEEIQSPPRSASSTDRINSLNKIAESASSGDNNGKFKKPTQSYIALISKAILDSPEKKLLLGDIYNYIMDQYPYYKYCGDKAWKNSIRHNLSLNECFTKNGRSDNGKGNFWSIHPACIEDFKKGDFRRRQARRRAKRCHQQQQQQQSPPQMGTTGLYNSPNPLGSLPYTYGYQPVPSGYLPNQYAGLQQYYSAPQQQQSVPLTTSSPMTSSQYLSSHLPSSYAGYLQTHSTQATTAPPNVTTAHLYQQSQMYGQTPSQLYTSASTHLHAAGSSQMYSNIPQLSMPHKDSSVYKMMS